MRQEQLFREFSRGHKFSFRKVSRHYSEQNVEGKLVVFGFATQFGVARITREIRNCRAKFGQAGTSVETWLQWAIKTLHSATNSDSGQSTALINRSPGRTSWTTSWAKLCTELGSPSVMETEKLILSQLILRGLAGLPRVSAYSGGGSKKFILVDSAGDWTATMAKINSDSNEGW